MNKIIVLMTSLLPVAALASMEVGHSCDTWVAMSDATIDGSVILAKNSDRPTIEAQPLVQHPRRCHNAGETVKCTYITIPQVDETCEHIGSKIWWSFGFEHGMNEHGVAIGNEAVFSKEPYEQSGLLGMDFLRLALERSKSAAGAKNVIVDLLQRYGQGGDCERKGEWGGSFYHNSFLIADPQEAWVLETAGHYWAAKRIVSGVYSISNIYTIETDWDESHPDLVEHAIEMGWTHSEQTFNFARDYGGYWEEESPHPGGIQIRRNATLACLKMDYKRISPMTMMNINRHHLEGTIAGPRWSPAEPFWAMPCAHDSARVKYRTVASMVAHLRPFAPSLLRQVYWASFSNPCCGVFQPFYLHGPKIPNKYSRGTSTYSSDAPWWSATRVKALCDLNYHAVNPCVRKVFDVTEQWELKRQQVCEADVLRLVKTGRKHDAVRRIQKFVDENVTRIDREYEALDRQLPELLKEAGVKYLFAQYLNDWSLKAKLPLPSGFIPR